MLCRAIAEKGFENIVRLLDGAEMAEIRIEETGLTVAEVEKLFSTHKNLVATCRPATLTIEQQKDLLTAAINKGAAWVDIEIEAEEEYRKNLIELAKTKGCKVIISYHDYEKTPDLDDLVQICYQAHGMGADLIKLACMCKTKLDVLNLLEIYRLKLPVLSLGMGKIGAITRIAALELGAPFTFVSFKGIEQTAPGQIDENVLRDFLSQIK
jgi:3-dehydroquinate dehydratase I